MRLYRRTPSHSKHFRQHSIHEARTLAALHLTDVENEKPAQLLPPNHNAFSFAVLNETMTPTLTSISMSDVHTMSSFLAFFYW